MRYLPHTEAERRAMLDVIGAPSVDTLFEDVPADLRGGYAFDLPPHQGELEVERALSKLAGENVAAGAITLTAGELAEPFAMSQPAVSKHLKVLERAGLSEGVNMELNSVIEDRVPDCKNCSKRKKSF